MVCPHLAQHYATIVQRGDPLPTKFDKEPEPEPADDNPPPEVEWAAVHAQRRNETAKFRLILRDLCRNIMSREQTPNGGRPPAALRDMIFAMVYWVYSKKPSEIFVGGDLEDARHREFVESKICPNTLCNYTNDARVTPLLQSLIAQTAAIFSTLEDGLVAVDKTGISLKRFRRWRTEPTNKSDRRLVRDWAGLHLMCGCRSGVVTAVEVCVHGPGNEHQYLRGLLETTMQQFVVRRVLADAQYHSYENVLAVHRLGAILMSPPKRGNTGKGDRVTTEAAGVWQLLHHFYKYRRTAFNRYYRKRRMVESVFSAIKRRFGEHVRSKKAAGIVNEVLCKILAYNIVLVIKTMYDAGLEPDFCSEPTLQAVRASDQ